MRIRVAQTQQRAGTLDRDAELFPQLARQGRRAGLARLDLAARKFPAAGEVLAGGPLRDVVLLNSAAALLVAGRAANLYEGAELAARSIDSGTARRVLENLVAHTNLPAAAQTTQ